MLTFFALERKYDKNWKFFVSNNNFLDKTKGTKKSKQNDTRYQSKVWNWDLDWKSFQFEVYVLIKFVYPICVFSGKLQ